MIFFEKRDPGLHHSSASK